METHVRFGDGVWGRRVIRPETLTDVGVKGLCTHLLRSVSQRLVFKEGLRSQKGCAFRTLRRDNLKQLRESFPFFPPNEFPRAVFGTLELCGLLSSPWSPKCSLCIGFTVATGSSGRSLVFNTKASLNGNLSVINFISRLQDAGGVWLSG